METILIIVGIILILAGFIGSLLPVVPGLPFSYLGLLALQLTSTPPFTTGFMILWLFIVAAVMVLDNVIPVYGTKKSGGSKFGIAGSTIGMVAGIFIFPPISMIVFPLVGAFLGEMAAGNTRDKAMKSAWGSFMGFMAATGLKVITAGVMGFYFFSNL